MKKLNRAFLILFFLMETVSCTSPSFYSKAYDFNKSISTENFTAAEKMLEDNEEKLSSGKIRFLYWVNGGMVEHLKQDFEKSNAYFEKADLFIEDEQKKAGEEAAALLINPKLSTYRGEDHEVLFINYYKALNYYLMGEINEALVEVRRLNLRLQQLSEKYKKENKYTQDAFMHLLMGLIYDADKNYNDAFIAYRNAFEIYENSYLSSFQLGAPDQLKEDLIRTAALSGMGEEMRQYEEKFDKKYTPAEETSNVVVLWHNGMGPVKEEWGINFAIIDNGRGWVSFVSKEYGLSYPFYVGNSDLSGVTWIKVAFPKYVTRKMLFTSASVEVNDNQFPLQLAEDVNAISFKVLAERMDLEFSKSLLRVALKQAAAYKVGQNNDSPALGAALSIAASASESADTRNWQTLPHSIYYVRVPVPSGTNQISLNLTRTNGVKEKHLLDVNLKKDETHIYPFYSLGAYEPVMKNK